MVIEVGVIEMQLDPPAATSRGCVTVRQCVIAAVPSAFTYIPPGASIVVLLTIVVVTGHFLRSVAKDSEVDVYGPRL